MSDSVPTQMEFRRSYVFAEYSYPMNPTASRQYPEALMWVIKLYYAYYRTQCKVQCSSGAARQVQRWFKRRYSASSLHLQFGVCILKLILGIIPEIGPWHHQLITQRCQTNGEVERQQTPEVQATRKEAKGSPVLYIWLAARRDQLCVNMELCRRSVISHAYVAQSAGPPCHLILVEVLWFLLDPMAYVNWTEVTRNTSPLIPPATSYDAPRSE
jgi:hypothetical protein